MSEKEKDNKEFEFIKEQVIQKKRKKFKRWLIPIFMTVIMAILFGLVAAVTFCIAEPRLYMFLHKEEESKTPITFPTDYPENSESEDKVNPSEGQEDEPNPQTGQTDQPEPVIVERSIDADLDDYLSIYDDIKTIAYRTNKSLVTVSSIINSRDWFGNPVEKKIVTTGVVIANNNADLLILVSLDRVEDASSINIQLTNSVSVEAKIQDYESEINLAVIAVGLEDIPSIFMNSVTVASLGESYTVTAGTPVIALGNPNGYPNSMEFGMVTSRGSSISITDNKLDLFNTNIRVNDNGDGVIINLRGEIIGLITRTLKEDLNEDLNTVIGISKIKSIIARMANQDPKIYFGVKTEDMTETAKLEHSILNGIYVNEVKANSPAFAAGIKNGDIILKIDDKNITNTNIFNNILSSHQPGDKIVVSIKRTSTAAEKEIQMNIELVEKEK